MATSRGAGGEAHLGVRMRGFRFRVSGLGFMEGFLKFRDCSGYGLGLRDS